MTHLIEQRRCKFTSSTSNLKFNSLSNWLYDFFTSSEYLAMQPILIGTKGLEDVHNLQAIKVKHPKGDAIICLKSERGHFYEIQKYQSKYMSWFINQRVNDSSEYHIVNQIDMRFLCLPFLLKNGSRYSPLDQIIRYDESDVNFDRIPIEHANTWKLADMCDINDKFDDMTLYRYNETKVLEWLQLKVNKISVCLLQHQVNRRSNFSSNFNSSAQRTSSTEINSNAQPSSMDTLSAAQIVCDYLSEEMSTKLLAHLGLSEADVLHQKVGSQSNKRKADWELELEVIHKLINIMVC